MIVGLTREGVGGQLKFVPGPTLAFARTVVDARDRWRNTSQPEGARCFDNVGYHIDGVGGAGEGGLEFRHRIDMIIVIMRYPAGGYLRNFAVGLALLQRLDNRRATTVHHQGFTIGGNDYPSGAKVAQKVRHRFAGADRHMVGAPDEFGEYPWEIVAQGCNRYVAIVRLLNPLA